MGKKVDEKAKCPYCGHEDYYTFYLGSEDLWCHGCGLSFFIEEKLVVKINSHKKYCKCLCDREREVYDCYKTIPDEKGHYTQDCETISYLKASECECGIPLENKDDFKECSITYFYRKYEF